MYNYSKIMDDCIYALFISATQVTQVGLNYNPFVFAVNCYIMHCCSICQLMFIGSERERGKRRERERKELTRHLLYEFSERRGYFSVLCFGVIS